MIRKRGFTLIELVITISITAILLSILLPSYSYYIRKGRNEDIISEGTEIFQVVVWSYENNNCTIEKDVMESDLRDILNKTLTVNKVDSSNISLAFLKDGDNCTLQVNLGTRNYKIIDNNEGATIYEGT